MQTGVLYKRDSKGKLRTWQAETDGPKWRSHAGLEDGKKVVSEWTTCTPKSQDTAEAQAEFEANAAYQHNLTREYRASVAELDAAGDTGTMMFKPQLAEKFEEQQDLLKKAAQMGVKLFSQPKLDGVRCIVSKDGMFSREGKPIFSSPHVRVMLEGFFRQYPDIVVDGELYNHDLKHDFEKIISLAKKQKPTPEQLLESAKMVQFHAYDCCIPANREAPFSERFFWLVEKLYGLDIIKANWSSDTCIRAVPTTDFFGINLKDLDAHQAAYLEDGYEGQMVRIDGPYENKRSKRLLKRKEFSDAEFTILRVEEGLGNWSGCAKRIVFQLPDGRECGAGVRGSQAEMKRVLAEKDQYVGGEVTIRYFNFTNDAVPRFPVATALFKGKRDI